MVPCAGPSALCIAALPQRSLSTSHVEGREAKVPDHSPTTSSEPHLVSPIAPCKPLPVHPGHGYRPTQPPIPFLHSSHPPPPPPHALHSVLCCFALPPLAQWLVSKNNGPQNRDEYSHGNIGKQKVQLIGNEQYQRAITSCQHFANKEHTSTMCNNEQTCPLLHLVMGWWAWWSCGASCCVPVLPLVIVLAL